MGAGKLPQENLTLTGRQQQQKSKGPPIRYVPVSNQNHSYKGVCDSSFWLSDLCSQEGLEVGRAEPPHLSQWS